MGKSIITPRVLKGFRDYLPEINLPRQNMIRHLEDVFQSFGFSPIDTPAMEYAEILLGKGSEESDKQLYRFKDNGDRDVALRFDLTVPLARFVAMHIHELGTPFKRYHIGPVWRAEKPQRGRYREFIQCDFDIIGSKEVLADAEIVSIINSALNKLSINHLIRLNDRSILNGLLEQLKIADKSVIVLRAIDKLEKLGVEVAKKEMKEDAGMSEEQCSEVLGFLEISKDSKSAEDTLKSLKEVFDDSSPAFQGIIRLENILETLDAYKIDQSSLSIDLSIARGLDYYTSTVFETVCTDLPTIGSICSGGRYDDLAGLYTKKELPGVGASIGLDRLLAALEELGKLDTKSTPAKVLVTTSQGHEASSIIAAKSLREIGINTEVFSENKKLGAQFKYADKRKIRFAVIVNFDSTEPSFNLKDLDSGDQLENLSTEELTKACLEKIN